MSNDSTGSTGWTRIAGAAGAVAVTAAVVLAGAGTASAATGDFTGQDRAFLVVAHQSNLAEIGSGTLAQDKATGSDIRVEGRMWIKDHTKLDAAGAALAKKYAATLPTTPNAEQKAAAAGLAARSGESFDDYWIRVGLDGHLKTLAAVRKEIADGSAPDVVAAARTAEPIVVEHIASLRDLAGAYGVGVPSSVAAGTGGQAAAQGPASPAATPLVAVGLAVAGAGGWTMYRRSRRGTAE